MSRLIICTIGTSLLTNTSDTRPWSGWRAPKLLPDEELVKSWLAAANRTEASAETNTLHRLELCEADTLALLHSQTSEGEFCAKRLGELYAPACRRVTVCELGRLGYGAAQFTAGLKSLIGAAIKLVTEARDSGSEPLFCATGGFKAEIALLNVLGALLEVEVVYLHEQHRELVRLPRLPLAWDASFVADNADFFEWIDAEPRGSLQVESWLKGRPALRSLVEDGGDGCTYLTAAGDLLYRAAVEQQRAGQPAEWPDADPTQPADKNGVSGEQHHRPDGWKRYVDRLCSIAWVCRVRYDTAAFGGAKVKVLDADTGELAIRYGPGGNELPLRVETTARGVRQCELIATYFRNLKP